MGWALSPQIREERRGRILDVATAVFLERGYGATTMKAICDALGGSKSTLYSYFAQKEDLLEAIILRQCEGLFAALEAAEGPGPFAEAVVVLARAFMWPLVSEEGVRTLQLIIEASRRDRQLAERFERVSMTLIVERVRDLIARACARGDIASRDPAEAAGLFMDLFRGDLHFRRLLNLEPEPDAARFEAEVARATSLFLRYCART
jgi:AcrR family transcriptional regulator